MKLGLTSAGCRAGLIALWMCLSFAAWAGANREIKFEASLVWATNDEKSPDPNQKPPDEAMRKKLRELPLKWKNYFVVTNVPFAVALGSASEVTLSDKCRLNVKDAGEPHVEVSLIGQGEPVLKRTQQLVRGKMLVLGGDAPDQTGWLVVLKRTE